MKPNDRYALHADGVWMYYLGDDHRLQYLADGVVPDADGTPMTPLHARGWWATDHEATTITVRLPGPSHAARYRLRDDTMQSEKFPVELTVEEWNGRYALDEDDVPGRIYRPIYEQGPDEVITLTGPWTRLDGAPPPDDGRTWVASLPHALTNRTEYLHLFPGRLTGFRDHIAALAEAHPHRKYVFRNEPRRGLRVTFEVPFDRPVTQWLPPRNRDGSVSKAKGRKGQTITVRAHRELVLDVPHDIPGENRAEAAAAWDRLTAHYRSILDGVGVAACSACRGNGYINPDDTTPANGAAT